MVSAENYQRYIYLLILVVVLFVTFLLIKPFILAILGALIIAYVFNPWHKRILKRVKNRSISALITCIIVILLITVPLVFVMNAVTREAYVFYVISRQKIASGDVLEGKCESRTLVCNLVNYVRDKFSDPKVKFYLEGTVKKATNYVIDNISRLPSKLAFIGLNIAVVVFLMFYFFKDGPYIIKRIESLVPIKRLHQKHIIKKFDDVTYAVIYGSIITALIQGTIGAIGFFIFGISSPILWGIVMVLAALIPFIGTPIIWVPAALIQILNGYIMGDGLIIGKGIGLLIYGALIISSIDNFVKPKVIGDKAKVHPTVVLLGVLGGLIMFGIVGFVIGPLILAFSITFLEIYRKELT